MSMRIQHEIEPSCVLRTFFGMSTILVSLAKVLPKAQKSPDGHTMGKDALTNSPTSSGSVPDLKISIIVCPSSARCGAYMKEFFTVAIRSFDDCFLP